MNRVYHVVSRRTQFDDVLALAAMCYVSYVVIVTVILVKKL